jgi:hypothetical protein
VKRVGPNPPIGSRVTDGVALAILGRVCLIFGVIVLVYALSLDSTAREFQSAAACEPGFQNTNCYERRAIGITEVGTGRGGEVNTVSFLDSGSPHEVSLGPTLRDRSVLRSGASGIAVRWHGMYTNLVVEGIDFATDENPVGQHSLWTVFGVLGVAFASVLWAASFVWHLMNPRGLTPADNLSPPNEPV